MPTFYIAEVNIARLHAPIDHPMIKDFADGLDRINALAENSAGFVWRLKDDAGNATSFKPYADELIVVNLSVWETVDALFQYVYSSEHVDFFRRRKEWFSKLETPYFAFWWQPAEQMPTLQEGVARLDYFTQHGATPYAFTFKKRFTLEESLAYIPPVTE